MSELSTREKLGVLSDMVHGREPAYARHDWSRTNGGIADEHLEARDCDPHHGVIWELVFSIFGIGR